MDSAISRQMTPAASSVRLNRRSHPRYAMVLREAVLTAGAERVPCIVRNISSSGLMARVYRRVELGETVKFELAGGRHLEGAVLWSRDWEVGVAFPDPIDVEALLTEQWVTKTDGDRRSSLRVDVECPATLQVRLRFYYGKLCDLSPTGARVRTHGALKKTGAAMLSLPGLPPLPATIRWVRDKDCGVQFQEPIPAEALALWLEERGLPARDNLED
jgi:hypothetical protein